MSLKNNKVILDSFLYMGFILILCSIPDISDKIYLSIQIQDCLHMPLFGVLAFMWMRAFNYNEWSYGEAIFHTLAICIIYGALTEFYQSLIPGRFPSLADFTFNTIGSVLGTIIYRYNKR